MILYIPRHVVRVNTYLITQMSATATYRLLATNAIVEEDEEEEDEFIWLHI